MTEEVKREDILEEPLDPVEALLKRELALLPKEEVPAEEGKAEVIPDKGYSEIELKAIEQGWKPQDQLEEGKTFKTAERFLEDGQLFAKIEAEKAARKKAEYEHKRELAEIKKQVAEAKAAGYEQALQDAKKLRDEAVDYANRTEFNKYDALANDLTQKLATERATIAAVDKPPERPEVTEFKARNADWLNVETEENARMFHAAASASNMIALSNPGIAPEEELKLVEKEIARLFPHRFVNEKKVAPAPVARAPDGTFAATKPASDLSITYEDLNPLQKQACQTLLRLDPKATVTDYLRGLERTLKRTY